MDLNKKQVFLKKTLFRLMDIADLPVVQTKNAKVKYKNKNSLEKYPIEALTEKVYESKILNCEKCQSPVKPDVILFGEKLPINLMAEVPHIQEADLVFIMGTSLKVFPFNTLVRVINKNSPVVLVNYDDVVTTKGYKFTKYLFLEGDIDTSIQRLCDSAGLELDE